MAVLSLNSLVAAESEWDAWEQEVTGSNPVAPTIRDGSFQRPISTCVLIGLCLSFPDHRRRQLQAREQERRVQREQCMRFVAHRFPRLWPVLGIELVRERVQLPTCRAGVARGDGGSCVCQLDVQALTHA
jgi:hypothetical protein